MIRLKKAYNSMKDRLTKDTRKYKNYITTFIVSVMFIIAIVLAKYGFDTKPYPVYNYNIQKSNNYEVRLKPNIFYTTEILPSGNVYASKSIDMFTINFLYNFEGNDYTDIEYNYNITANLVGTVQSEEEEKEVWSREYILAENKIVKEKDINTWSINEWTNIDFEKYVNLVHSYEQTYGITLNAVLKIRLNVSYIINLNKYELDKKNNNDYIELDIPISNTITQVKENYENVNYENIIYDEGKIQTKKIILYIFSGVLVIGAIVTSLIKLKINNKKITVEERHRRNVNHILKNYSDLIVTVINAPNLTKLNIMEVIKLDDLIDVAEQNNCHIIHHKIVEKNEDNLYVIVKDDVYIYKII